MESVSAMDVSVQTFSPPVTRSSLPLPEELVLEIFLRLPTKAIARCRCLSKLWSSMLRSQYFTELFLTKSCASPQLLFALQDDTDVVFFSLLQPHNPKENSYVVTAKQLARFPSSYILFYAPTSGFFCYLERIFERMEEWEFVPVICNPSTGQSLILPTLKCRSRYTVVGSYLGYDPIAKEFKVFSIECSYVSGGERISANHQVLTLGTNKLSWRLVECCVPHYSFHKWICINGVLYYTAAANSLFFTFMVVCFDLRSEKLSFVELMETFSLAMEQSTTMVNYNGKLGLLMSRDYGFVSSTSFELWVLQDGEWSKHVYVLPLLWKDVVTENMYIAGMIGTNEIVFSPTYQRVPSYVIYYNVESKTIRKVWIQGMEAFQGKSFYTFLNYVENVKLL